jgi:hypothetical protein
LFPSLFFFFSFIALVPHRTGFVHLPARSCLLKTFIPLFTPWRFGELWSCVGKKLCVCLCEGSGGREKEKSLEQGYLFRVFCSERRCCFGCRNEIVLAHVLRERGRDRGRVRVSTWAGIGQDVVTSLLSGSVTQGMGRVTAVHPPGGAERSRL